MMYLLDTSVLIDYLQKKRAAVDFVERHQSDRLTTSSVCVFELYCGILRLHDANRREFLSGILRDLIESLSEIFPFDGFCAELAAFIWANLEDKGQRIDDTDVLIAATVMKNHAILVTGNVGHFSRIQGLEIVNPALP